MLCWSTDLQNKSIANCQNNEHNNEKEYAVVESMISQSSKESQAILQKLRLIFQRYEAEEKKLDVVLILETSLCVLQAKTNIQTKISDFLWQNK